MAREELRLRVWDEEDLMMLEDLSLDGDCIGPNPKLEVATCLGRGEFSGPKKKKI